jgi:hypothetical protein
LQFGRSGGVDQPKPIGDDLDPDASRSRSTTPDHRSVRGIDERELAVVELPRGRRNAARSAARAVVMPTQ